MQIIRSIFKVLPTSKIYGLLDVLSLFIFLTFSKIVLFFVIALNSASITIESLGIEENHNQPNFL